MKLQTAKMAFGPGCVGRAQQLRIAICRSSVLIRCYERNFVCVDKQNSIAWMNGSLFFNSVNLNLWQNGLVLKGGLWQARLLSNKNELGSTSKDTAELQGKQPESNAPVGKSTQRTRLAKVFAEYGSTAVVFHTTISLTSLGLCYFAVSSGIDVVGLMQKVGIIAEVSTEAKVAGGASTFVIAYACHKVFMPVRIFLTVTCTPLIVKKLRQIGLLKTPPQKS